MAELEQAEAAMIEPGEQASSSSSSSLSSPQPPQAPQMRRYLKSSSSNRGVCRIEINDTKAGMENIDKEKINAIIMKNTLSNARSNDNNDKNELLNSNAAASRARSILRLKVLPEAEDT